MPSDTEATTRSTSRSATPFGQGLSSTRFPYRDLEVAVTGSHAVGDVESTVAAAT